VRPATHRCKACSRRGRPRVRKTGPPASAGGRFSFRPTLWETGFQTRTTNLTPTQRAREETLSRRRDVGSGQTFDAKSPVNSRTRTAMKVANGLISGSTLAFSRVARYSSRSSTPMTVQGHPPQGQQEVHQEPGNAPVAVREGMNVSEHPMAQDSSDGSCFFGIDQVQKSRHGFPNGFRSGWHVAGPT
jgi:hypothetical protein